MRNLHKKLSRDPLLSVVVVTYQHENYIKECLDSILMQDVDFKFEVIVSDDCSSDNTAEIIQEYERNFPGIVKSILRSVNVGPTKNLYECFLKCTGKYIAILEGDDFWTDNNKLKMQVKFLEDNEKYIACTQRYSVVDQHGNTVHELYTGPGAPKSGKYTLNDFTKYIYYGHIGTLLFRNIFIKPKYDFSIIHKADRFVGDITLCLILTLLGEVFISDENMMSYRNYQVVGGTNFCSHIAKKNGILERVKFLDKLKQYCLEEFGINIHYQDRMPHNVWWSILFVIRYPSVHNWKCLWGIYLISGKKKHVFVYILKQLPGLPIMVFALLKKIWKKRRLI